jgi:hypothetical protein
MHMTREVIELLVFLGVPGLLIAVAVVALWVFDLNERGLFEEFKRRPQPKELGTPPIPPTGGAKPLSEEELEAALDGLEQHVSAGADDARPDVEPPRSPAPSTFDILVERQVRYEAERAVAGPEERLRRLRAEFATRDAIIRAGGTPTPHTAQELLSKL